MKGLSLLKKIIPWAITLALFVYIFYQIPPEKVAHAFSFANYFYFIGIALIYFLLLLIIDTYSLTWVLSRFCNAVSFREMLPARGVTYLLSLLNYNAGQIGLALFMKKTHKTSFFMALGSLLFILVIDLYWVIFFAFVGSFLIPLELKGIDINRWVQTVSIFALLGLLFHLLFWWQDFPRYFPKLENTRPMQWLRKRHLFQAFQKANLSDYLKLALFRLPMLFLIVSSMYFVMISFQSKISYFTIISTMPVIMLIGVLPLTPGGLGTVQAASIEFFKNRISSPLFLQQEIHPEEIILAASLAWMFGNYLLKALFGALCLRKTQSNLFSEDASIQEE